MPSVVATCLKHETTKRPWPPLDGKSIDCLNASTAHMFKQEIGQISAFIWFKSVCNKSSVVSIAGMDQVRACADSNLSWKPSHVAGAAKSASRKPAAKDAKATVSSNILRVSL